jgi:hypothetical protein
MKRLTYLFILASSTVFAQTETIRGTITDVESKVPLIGATVILLDSDPIVGASTDIDGKFKLENVAVGRCYIKVTYLGYNPAVLSGLVLTSGKELVLNIELEEQVMQKGEVVVSASREKEKPMNTMTTVSARVFSTEEADRFAGARQDVSRMASNFAGIRSANDAQNDIVIRGNSPLGLLWRLDGVDVPNPNHFGNMGATGGPVSMLNGNVLANSDFMTSAFPSEYGNAVSGVFDLKLRSGNNEKHQFLGQLGFNGLELGAEGPFSKKQGSSYLINYRYSTLGLLGLMGVNFGTGSAIPEYQDLSFKVRFPTKKAGIFELFGMGGISSINLLASEEKDTSNYNLYGRGDSDVRNRNMLGVVGLTHTYILPKNAYTKFTLAASSIVNRNVVDSLDAERGIHDWYRSDFQNHRFQGAFFYKKKFSAKHSVKVGVRGSAFYTIMKDSAYNNQWDRYVTLTDFEGVTGLIEPYMQWQWKWNDKWTMNTGLHGQYLTINNSYAVEPRWGLAWKVAEKHSLSMGYGLHSQMAPMAVYFNVDEDALGNKTTPNKNVDFVRSQHFVLGYDWSLLNNMRFKAETYYQHIYNAIVDADSSSYSALNFGGFNTDEPEKMTNKGTGNNYGLELTFEKFLTKGYYWLLTGSLYDSKYRASDGITRNTAFNGNYVLNALGGYELQLFKNREHKTSNYLLFDVKFTLAGGSRYTPIDEDASALAGEAVYRNDLAFSEQFKPYYRLDIRVGYKRIGRKVTQELAFDIQNVTNKKNPLNKAYDAKQNTLVNVNQLGLFPMLLYRINF